MEMQETEKQNGSAEAVPKKQNVDILKKIIGSFGKYHLWICFLIYLSKFPVAFHQMAIIFLSPKASYICPDTGGQTCPCDKPIYDTSVFNKSIIMQWDLICENSWLRDFTQTLFQLGVLLGSVLFGMASDRFGRKRPLIVAVVIQVFGGIGAAYITHYWGFTIVRFFVGASVGGTMVVGFVIMMEFVGNKHRDVVSSLYQTPFNTGHILLAVFGYYFRDYSEFQLWISVPTVILLSYIFFLPESPRWLLVMKKKEEAIKVMEHIAKINNRPTDTIRAEVEQFLKKSEGAEEIKKGSVIDLFRTPNIRRNTIAMSFNWMVCSYCFYGVSQYVGQLSGNVFLNVAASASVTLLGTFLSIPLVRYVGRKTIVIIFNIISGLCIMLLAVIPEGTASVVLASIGVVTSFIVFVTVYLYCVELFPTVVRNAAMGVSSMMARVGSMVAPFVVGLNDVGRWMPPIAFGVMPLVAAGLCLLLPETRGCELLSTIEEGENFGVKENTSKKTALPKE